MRNRYDCWKIGSSAARNVVMRLAFDGRIEHPRNRLMNTKNQIFSACWVVLECRKEEWCCRGGSNSGPLPYQGSALPLSYGSNWRWAMAAREARIHARPTPVAQGGDRKSTRLNSSH